MNSIPFNAQSYSDKPADYFNGQRLDILELMDENPSANVLEIGCGSGENGRVAKDMRRAGRFVGVELDPAAAERARQYLDIVLLGNVEELDLAKLGGPFDAVIISEVLEHLIDPWLLVKRVKAVMKPGARIFASSPNIANLKLVGELLRGNFDYTEAGVMDRTHLRWFTPRTYREMFEQAGFRTTTIRHVGKVGPKWKLINSLSRGRFSYLGGRQIFYIGQVPA